MTASLPGVSDLYAYSTAIVLLLGCGVLMIGCRNERRSVVSVAGKVSVAGEELSGAVITFEPIDSTPGPKASAPVMDGNYRIESTANLQPGKYAVRISMLPEEIANQIRSDAPNERSPRREISPAFDGQSKLTTQLVDGENSSVNFEVSFR